jgi:serine/threonine protein kinase
VAIGRPLAEALRFMHGCGWIHVDVKPGNIFIDQDGNGHLGDYGSAALPGTMLFGRGTPEYQCPAISNVARPAMDLVCLATSIAEKAGILRSPPGRQSLNSLQDTFQSVEGDLGDFLRSLLGEIGHPIQQVSPVHPPAQQGLRPRPLRLARLNRRIANAKVTHSLFVNPLHALLTQKRAAAEQKDP